MNRVSTVNNKAIKKLDFENVTDIQNINNNQNI